MEKVQALINTLQAQVAEKSSPADMLRTTEALRTELLQLQTENSFRSATVTVWMPGGMAPAPVEVSTSLISTSETIHSNGSTADISFPAEERIVPQAPKPPAIIEEVETPIHEDELPEPSEFVLEVTEEMMNEPLTIVTEAESSPELSLPDETVEAVTEEEELSDFDRITKNLAKHIPSFRTVFPNSDTVSPAPISEAEPVAAALPVEKVVEEIQEVKESESIDFNDVTKDTIPFIPKVRTVYPDIPSAVEIPSIQVKTEPTTSIQETVQVHLQEAGTRDLNELIAERTAALNEVFAPSASGAAELAEVLSSTPAKVADLRRAISVNEKYQFINLLFRGDEDAFERSLKTLNNFNIYTEASYWMQRELVIKLSWNEEDELVKHFYRLVSKRFA